MAGQGSSVPLTSNTREALTCALCLEIYRDPRLLPCSHTFCKKCVDDLIQQHPEGSFPCPDCRKHITVSAEGSSGFQSNFYIDEKDLDRARNVTACSVHLQKQLDMFCLECDLLLCVDCKATAHLNHKAQTLQDARKAAEEQLSGDKARIREMKEEIQKRLPEHSKNLDQFKKKKAAIETKIRHRHAILVAEAERYLTEALASLEDACCTTEDTLSEDLQIILGNVQKLEVLDQKIDRALQDGDSCAIVNTATDVRTGCGSRESLQKMEVLPLQSISRPVHVADIPGLEAMFVSMKNFIGKARQKKHADTHAADVKVTAQYRCGLDDDTKVFCVCPADKVVFVSFEPSCKDKPLFDIIFFGYTETTTVHTLKTTSSTCSSGEGEICFSILLSKAVNRRTYVKNGNPDKRYCLQTSSDSAKGCVSSVKFEWDKKLKLTRHPLFMIDCGPHRAVDTNSAADLFAVVEEPRPPSEDRSRKVRLFRHGQRAAIATYQPPLTPCQPADVCFFMLKGQEVLLIADELNDAIHVVEVKVKDGCMTFSRFLTPCCPLLVQPTVLNLDPRGRLWVGCRGGRLLTVRHTTPEEEEEEGDDDDHDDDGFEFVVKQLCNVATLSALEVGKDCGRD